MNSFLAQLILAAQNRDAEGWVKVLVFVLLIAFYALGSIFKAKSRKVEQGEEEEDLAPKKLRKRPESLRRLQKQSSRPDRRPVGPTSRTEYSPQRQPAPRKVSRPQPPTRPTTQRQPTLQERLEMPELPELALESPQLKPAIEELPEFTSQTLKKLQARPLGITPQKPLLEDASRPIFGYADSDELTRAILHYEILGRPLSVRDPSQRIIGL